MPLSTFREDLKRWQRRDIVPTDATPLRVSLSLGQALELLWEHPAIWATALYRAGNWASRRRLRGLPSLFQRLNLLLFGCEIESWIPIGPGFYLPHPVGVHVSARSVGANASLIGAFTLGMRAQGDFPTLGDGVFIGVGARVLGAVHLGDGCRVGANAVVLESVPARATAAGVPARVVRAARQDPSRPALAQS
jgi:serine O-acetyltransferase